MTTEEISNRIEDILVAYRDGRMTGYNMYAHLDQLQKDIRSTRDSFEYTKVA